LKISILEKRKEKECDILRVFHKGSLKKKEFLGRKIKTANFSISKNLICAEAANVGYYGLLVECAWLSSMIGNATYRS
jgi:hypothetical protein